MCGVPYRNLLEAMLRSVSLQRQRWASLLNVILRTNRAVATWAAHFLQIQSNEIDFVPSTEWRYSPLLVIL